MRILSTSILWIIVFVAGAQGNLHDSWNNLLRKYVNEEGMVNYRGFVKDRVQLKKYLNALEKNVPNNTWSSNHRLAYWINAYNAYTIDLILEYYPVKSIKDLGSKIQIPHINSPWDIKFIEIGGEKMDLNNIEHGIIRKQFDEPRIHFALVCAAVSCPKLQNEAFYPKTLEKQLANATREFLADPSKNIFVSEKKARLSKLFSWYGGDFTKGQKLYQFLNKYSKTQLVRDCQITYLDYNWSLNEQ